jgi:hypothetical protein
MCIRKEEWNNPCFNSPFNTKQLVTWTYQISLHTKIDNFIPQSSGKEGHIQVCVDNKENPKTSQ